MVQLLRTTKSISVIETAPDFIFFKNLDRQRSLFSNGFIHQCSAKALPMIAGIKEEAADFILDKGNKTDDTAIDFRHPCLCEGHVHIAHIVGFLVQKPLC